MGKRFVIVAVGVAVAFLVGCQAPSVSRGGPPPDSTDALQSQLDALTPGGFLKLEPRLYAHQGVIKLRVPNVRIDGNGATFQATNDKTSAVQITADDVQVTNLNFTAATEGQRWGGLDQHKVVVSGDRDILTHVSVVGSAAAGIFVDGAADFTLEDVSVSGTRADGIHMTGASRNGLVEGVRTDRTGDDGIAVVSYGNETPCSDITISQATVGSTRWGRGIAVVGGRNVSVRDFSVANTNSAGLYVATEGSPYFTDSVESVTVSGGSVTNANQDSSVVQGAVLVYSGNVGKYVRGVQISDVNISGTPASAGRNVGIVVDQGSVDGISLSNISIGDSTVAAFDSNAPTGSYSTSGWTQDKNPITVS